MEQKNNNIVIYSRLILLKTISHLIKKGKKATANKILQNTFIKIRLITKKNPWILFCYAMNNLITYVETVKVRRAGKTYEIPVPAKKKRQLFLAFKWMLMSLKSKKLRNDNSFNLLTKEILSASNKRGKAFTQKRVVLKKAFNNKALSHFRW